MTLRRLFPAICAIGLLAGWGATANAQVVTWTGLALNDRFTDNPANWLGGTLPLNNGTEHFVFGPSAQSFPLFGTAMNANKVSIIGNTVPFILDDDYDILNLGAGGLVYAPASPVKSYIGAYNVTLLADQTWDIQSGEFGLYYDITGPGRITKTGAGTLNLQYSYLWTGGVTINSGRLLVDNGNSNWAFGSGNLIFGPPPGGATPLPTIATRDKYGYGYVTGITNPIDLNGILAAENEVELDLNGMVTLNTDSTIKSSGAPLFIYGKITNGPVATPAARKLTIDGVGAVVLAPTVGNPNDYTGGTHVANGVLIFADANAVPNTGLITIASTGYAGFAGGILAEQAKLLNQLDPLNVHGSIGFDTLPFFSTSTTFSTPITLTGFAADARLGSASSAILGSAAVITPQGTDYRFGGGGGLLQVDSQLTNAAGPATRNLVVDSPARHPLTVQLRNTTNDFTGTASVTHSALIFDAGAMPAGTNNFLLGTGGYIGTSALITPDAAGDSAISTFLAHFPAATNAGVIGFDHPLGYTGTVIANNLSLAGLGAGTYLGTSTPGYTGDGIGAGLTLTGTITPAGGAGAAFRFAGYKGGLLKVDSALTGSAGVIIGDPSSPATFGDFLEERYSTVFLNGNNTALSGNIQFYGGQLIVGQGTGVVGTDPSTTLGSGTLVVQPFPFPSGFADADGETPAPQLGASDYGLVIDRPVQLNTDLNIGLDNNGTGLSLTGLINGIGELYLNDYTNLTLTNDANSFTGGVYLGFSSSLTVGANHATGLGPLGVGSGTSTVYFATANPVVGGLDSREGDYLNALFQQNDSVLTINQAVSGTFNGEFRADTVANPTHNDSIRVMKSGVGTLRLANGGFYFSNAPVEASLPGTPQVSLQINEGTVEIANFYIQGTTPTIWVHGGTLALANNAYLTNNVIVVDNGGRLAGNGVFDVGTTSAGVTLGTGAIVSPGGVDGFSLGQLGFNALTFASGGTYEWNLVDATMVAGGAWDSIHLSNLSVFDVTATAGTPFTLKLSTVSLTGASALATGFDASQPYSWAILSASSIANFDPAKFTIDASLFANSLAFNVQGNGAFSLSLGGGEGAQTLNLNFTPVPEPSTYALLALGLGFVPLAMRRRRQRGGDQPSP